MVKKDTYIPRDEVVDSNREFNRVRDKVEEELMKIPGVVAVGVGLKEVKGEAQRRLCFKVTVKEKKEPNEIKASDRIPDSIFGIPTDVVETLVSLSGADSKKYRPLMGGSQIEPSSASRTGTLGCFAKRNSDNKIVLLSNWHVMVEKPDRIDGDRVGQPTHNGCCSCCATNEIAEVTEGRFMSDHMDAAIALLNGQESDTFPEYRYLNEVVGIGTIAGATAPLGGETVFKQGRTTGFTRGQVLNDNTGSLETIYDVYGGLSVTRDNIVVIEPSTGITDYFLKGDSGSVSLNEHHQVVALNYAFTTLHFTLAKNILTVATTLGITIPDSTFHANLTGKKGVPLSSIDALLLQTNLSLAMAELEGELGHFREGKRMLELFKAHRAELLDLVRHKREVIVAWNRYQGPAYLAHIARSVRRDSKPFPEQIKGITLQNLLLKMTAVLQRNGSPELARSVTDNYLQIMEILSSGRSPEDWKAYLAKYEVIGV